MGFIEVHTPLLSRDTVIDRYIDPVEVSLEIPGRHQERYFLQTSPEFAMKRLLADGAEAIYQITPAFRAGEVGKQHNIEFMMLEWYRVGDDYQAGMNLLDEFAQVLLQQQPASRLTYHEVFSRFADIDWQHDTPDHDTLNQLMASHVETALKQLGSAIVYDWPADQAALAKTRMDEASGVVVAERFELYVNGIELANGYHELTDADELLRRNRIVNEQRAADENQPLPEQSRLIEAMRKGLPDCCGVALGIDRLLMLACGADSLDGVTPQREFGE